MMCQLLLDDTPYNTNNALSCPVYVCVHLQPIVNIATSSASRVADITASTKRVSSKASGKKSSSTPSASTQSKEAERVVLDQEKENEVDQHVPAVKIPRGETGKDHHHPDSVFGPFSSGVNRLNSPVTRSSRSTDRSKPIAIAEVPKDRDSYPGGGPFNSSQHSAIDLAASTHGVAAIDLVPLTNSCCSYTIEVLSGPYAGQVVPLSTLLKCRISATRGWELQFGRADHCDCSLPLDIYLSEM